MKSKVLLIVLVLIIVALLIILGIKLFEKKPKYTVLREAEEIWVPADHTEEGKNIVRDHIGDIIEKLAAMSGELTQEKINKVIRPFFLHAGPAGPGRRFVVNHDGDLVMGPAFPAYLTSHLQHISEINFELTWFVSEEFTAEQPDDKDFFHFVHFGFKVSYLMANGDLIDPPGGGGDYHIRECEWIDP